MSISIVLEMPQDVFSALHQSPLEFAKELRLTAAVKWYELGTVSQEKAAEIAGLSRSEFIAALSRFKVAPFQVTVNELYQDLSNAV
jgi:predicted HTH domain antitoxin